MPESPLRGMGWGLFGVGVVLALCGLALVLLGRLPGIGRLPGDILIRRGGTTIYFPIVTCILLSIVVTLLLNLILRR